jgi:hypothetical protein
MFVGQLHTYRVAGPQQNAAVATTGSMAVPSGHRDTT